MVLQVALLGCGTIGSCVANELLNNSHKYKQAQEINLKHILVNNIQTPRKYNLDNTHKDLFTTDIDVIINSNIDIVIELLGNEEPARDYILKCMNSGKHIVTANKELVAKHLPELIATAQKNNIQLKFEASVMAGVPVISTLQTDLLANNITEVLGILNGTTNYMLTHMSQGASYSEILQKAQDLGYAEPDPTNDVEGYDIRYKTSILSSLAYQSYMPIADIPCQGITNINQEDFYFAKEFNCNIKLLGHSKRLENNSIYTNVGAYLISNSHALSNINNELNALYIAGDLIGGLTLIGSGAGDKATTSGILNDMLTIGQFPQISLSMDVSQAREHISEIPSAYYIRLIVSDQSGVIANIGDCLSHNNISLKNIHQKDINQQMNVCLITHEIQPDQYKQTIQELMALAEVQSIACEMKVL